MNIVLFAWPIELTPPLLPRSATMLAFLFLLCSLALGQNVCTYNGYPCTYKGTVCTGRSCPVCNDANVANEVTNNLLNINSLIYSNNVSSANKSSVDFVSNGINDGIQYCQSSYSWPAQIDKGGFCMGHSVNYSYGICESQFGFACYQQDCTICKASKICNPIIANLTLIRSVIQSNNFYAGNNNTNAINNINTQITNTINYCEQYSSSNTLAVTHLTLLLLLVAAIANFFM